MFELIRSTRAQLATKVLMGALAVNVLTGCIFDGDDPEPSTRPDSDTSVGDIVKGEGPKPSRYSQAICEAIAKSDSDCDGVFNRFDKHPGRDDWYYDADQDGIIDALDTAPNMNDIADNDGDTLLNGIDTKPTVSAVQVQSQDKRLQDPNYYATLNQQYKRFLSYNTVPTYTPNDFTRDNDHDGYTNYFDHAQNNTNVGGDTDPWLPGSKAYEKSLNH